MDAALPPRPVLVTGCSSGIGRTTAIGLKARGYRVFATARTEADLKGLGGLGLEAVHLELADPEAIAACVDRVLEATGGTLYGLFNNAAYGQPGAVEDLPMAALREQFEVNLFGTHEMTRRMLPVMRAQGYGRIVMTSSVLGFVCMPFRGAYNASKYALEGYCDTLRLELSGSGVHVVLVQPGPIRSRFRDNAYAAFLRHIDPEHSVHRTRYQAMSRRFQQEGPVMPFTLGPEAVLAKVIKALEAKHPRPRYRVTFPTYLFAALKRLLPTRLLDRILIRG